jgi:hypothetical protein
MLSELVKWTRHTSVCPKTVDGRWATCECGLDDALAATPAPDSAPCWFCHRVVPVSALIAGYDTFEEQRLACMACHEIMSRSAPDSGAEPLTDAQVEAIYAAFAEQSGYEATTVEGQRAIVEPMMAGVVAAIRRPLVTGPRMGGFRPDNDLGAAPLPDDERPRLDGGAEERLRAALLKALDGTTCFLYDGRRWSHDYLVRSILASLREGSALSGGSVDEAPLPDDERPLDVERLARALQVGVGPKRIEDYDPDEFYRDYAAAIAAEYARLAALSPEASDG